MKSTYALNGFADGDAELRRLDAQVAAMQHREFEVYRRLGLHACRVLDVGTGSGSFARALLEHGCDVTGVDEDPQLLASPRDYVCVRANAEHMPFADATFDASIARLVFQHLASPTTVAREMFRVTRAGGVVVISDTDHQSFIMDPDPKPVRSARERWIAAAESAGRDPFVGRKLHGLLHEAGARHVDTRVVTITSDEIGRETFSQLLLMPYVNWGLEAMDDARRAAREWAADPRSFGMASLMIGRGIRG